MRAGSMDRKISIIRRGQTKRPDGTFKLADTIIAPSVWAEKGRPTQGDALNIKPQVGIETQQGAVAADRIDIMWRIRYRTDIQNHDIVCWGGDEYEIMSIDEIARREGLILNTRSRNNQGKVVSWS